MCGICKKKEEGRKDFKQGEGKKLHSKRKRMKRGEKERKEKKGNRKLKEGVTVLDCSTGEGSFCAEGTEHWG